MEEKLGSSERVGDDLVFFACVIAFLFDCGWDKWIDEDKSEAKLFIRSLLIGFAAGGGSVLGIE
jgi:hypothetical protein